MWFSSLMFSVTLIYLKFSGKMTRGKINIPLGRVRVVRLLALVLPRLPLHSSGSVTGAPYPNTSLGPLTDEEPRSGKLSEPNKLALSKKPWRPGEKLPSDASLALSLTSCPNLSRLEAFRRSLSVVGSGHLTRVTALRRLPARWIQLGSQRTHKHFNINLLIVSLHGSTRLSFLLPSTFSSHASVCLSTPPSLPSPPVPSPVTMHLPAQSPLRVPAGPSPA